MSEQSIKGLHARCYVRDMLIPCVWCARLFHPYVDFPWHANSKACGACAAASSRDRRLERYPEANIPPIHLLTKENADRAKKVLGARGVTRPTCEQLFKEILHVSPKLKRVKSWR